MIGSVTRACGYGPRLFHGWANCQHIGPKLAQHKLICFLSSEHNIHFAVKHNCSLGLGERCGRLTGIKHSVLWRRNAVSTTWLTRGIHPMLFQCWSSVNQHWNSIGWMPRVCWEQRHDETPPYLHYVHVSKGQNWSPCTRGLLAV